MYEYVFCLKNKQITKIDFKEDELVLFDHNKKTTYYKYKYLQEKNIKCIDLKNNLLSRFDMINCPGFIENILLDNNFISILNFKGSHKFLKKISIKNNEVKTIFFEDAPLDVCVSENIKELYISYVLLNKLLE